MSGADRRSEAGFGAERIAAGDEGEIVGTVAQFVDEIGDQFVEPAGFADQANERLAGNGFFRREDSGFDAQHPLPPARGRGQIEKFNVEGLVPAPLPTAGGGGNRPQSRNAGRPVSSRAALRRTSRRTGAGRRGRSSARRAPPLPARRNPRPAGARRFGRSVRRAVWVRLRAACPRAGKTGGDVFRASGSSRRCRSASTLTGIPVPTRPA